MLKKIALLGELERHCLPFIPAARCTYPDGV
jgi:hypothetical protein